MPRVRAAAAMTRRGLLIAAGAVLTSAALGAAHPGHGTLAMVGTLVAVEPTRVTIEARDSASGAMQRTTAGIGPETKVRVGKEPATLADWVGASVVASIDYEEGVDGRPVYFASKIQITPKTTK